VTAEKAISFLGLDSARVLATPHLIWQLEATSRDLLKKFLDDGFDSVGTEVNVKHLAATPIGMQARFEAEIIAVDERRVRFRVAAYDDVEQIASGDHERFIVNAARFASRLEAKSAQRRGEG
jgi:predicted thioesterase